MSLLIAFFMQIHSLPREGCGWLSVRREGFKRHAFTVNPSLPLPREEIAQPDARFLSSYLSKNSCTKMAVACGALLPVL
jgi:hypothetical protein